MDIDRIGIDLLSVIKDDDEVLPINGKKVFFIVGKKKITLPEIGISRDNIV